MFGVLFFFLIKMMFHWICIAYHHDLVSILSKHGNFGAWSGISHHQHTLSGLIYHSWAVIWNTIHSYVAPNLFRIETNVTKCTKFVVYDDGWAGYEIHKPHLALSFSQNLKCGTNGFCQCRNVLSKNRNILSSISKFKFWTILLENFLGI